MTKELKNHELIKNDKTIVKVKYYIQSDILRISTIDESKPSGDEVLHLFYDQGYAILRAFPKTPMGKRKITKIERTIQLDNLPTFWDKILTACEDTGHIPCHINVSNRQNANKFKLVKYACMETEEECIPSEFTIGEYPDMESAKRALKEEITNQGKNLELVVGDNYTIVLQSEFDTSWHICFTQGQTKNTIELYIEET